MRLAWAGLGAIVLVVHLAGARFPRGPTWGFHQMAYVPIYLSMAAFAIALLLILAYVLGWRPTGIAGAASRLSANRRNWILFSAATSLLAGALFFRFPIPMMIYGDSHNMSTWHGGNQAFQTAWLTRIFDPNPFRSKEALTIAVHRSLAFLTGESVGNVYKIMSAVSGAAFLFVFLVSLGRKETSRPWVAPLALCGLFLGANLAFFGHIENYPFAFLCAVLFLAAAERTFESGRGLTLTAVLFFVAFRAHIVNVFLLPVVACLVMRRLASTRNLAENLFRWGAATRWLLAPTLALGALLYVFVFHSYDVVYTDKSLSGSFLPVVAPAPPLRGYTLLSVMHLLDLVNVFFMVGLPVVLAAPLALLAGRRGERGTEAWLVSLGLASALQLAFYSAVNPILSMPRDWDLFTLAAPALLFVVTSAAPRLSLEHRDGLLMVALVSALFVAPGYAMHVGRGRLGRHLEAAGEHVYRTYYSGASFLIDAGQVIGVKPQDTSRRRQATLARLEPWRQSEDPELAYLLSKEGEINWRLNRLEEAHHFIDESVAASQDEMNRERAAQLYLGLRDYKAARTQADFILARDPNNLAAARVDVILNILDKDRDKTIRSLDHALSLAPNDPDLQNYLAHAKETGLYPAAPGDSASAAPAQPIRSE